jgi:hypothetical protein
MIKSPCHTHAPHHHIDQDRSRFTFPPPHKPLDLQQDLSRRPAGDGGVRDNVWGDLVPSTAAHALRQGAPPGLLDGPPALTGKLPNTAAHSPIPTLENFLHTKLNTILLATLV